MKWLITACVAVTLSACNVQKSTVDDTRLKMVRCDTIGARLDDEWHVKFHNVEIIPSDSLLTRVRVEEVALTHERKAVVASESREHVQNDTQKSETPVRESSKFLLYLIITLLIYLLILRK